jgi:hypothetical protein
MARQIQESDLAGGLAQVGESLHGIPAALLEALQVELRDRSRRHGIE